jgi:hypothetical protein
LVIQRLHELVGPLVSQVVRGGIVLAFGRVRIELFGPFSGEPEITSV